jgi:transposase
VLAVSIQKGHAVGISRAFCGISMHDGWMSYRAFACGHALCKAHHLRELIFIEETFKHPWAQRMIDLLLDLKEQVHAAKARGQPALDPLTLARFSGEYDLIIAAGWQANPDLAQPEGKRSRKQHPARDRLASVAGGQVASACPPATNFAVPFDTNQAERDLCMLQVQQKVSGGWRTELGFQILCRLRSDLSTLHKQGMDLLHALQQTFLGHPVFPTLETPC